MLWKIRLEATYVFHPLCKIGMKLVIWRTGCFIYRWCLYYCGGGRGGLRRGSAPKCQIWLMYQKCSRNYIGLWLWKKLEHSSSLSQADVRIRVYVTTVKGNKTLLSVCHLNKSPPHVVRTNMCVCPLYSTCQIFNLIYCVESPKHESCAWALLPKVAQWPFTKNGIKSPMGGKHHENLSSSLWCFVHFRWKGKMPCQVFSQASWETACLVYSSQWRVRWLSSAI